MVALVAALAVACAQAQRNRQNRQRNNRNRNNNGNRATTTRNRNPVVNGGFRATPANARDNLGNEVYPGCNGTVCLPEANLCARRKQKRKSLDNVNTRFVNKQLIAYKLM